jgi:hypothetical protein
MRTLQSKGCKRLIMDPIFVMPLFNDLNPCNGRSIYMKSNKMDKEPMPNINMYDFMN